MLNQQYLSIKEQVIITWKQKTPTGWLCGWYSTYYMQKGVEASKEQQSEK